jgi:hypothetical protein
MRHPLLHAERPEGEAWSWNTTDYSLNSLFHSFSIVAILVFSHISHLFRYDTFALMIIAEFSYLSFLTMHTIAIPPNQHFYAGAIRALELSHES